jgi:hypothetical protein
MLCLPAESGCSPTQRSCTSMRPFFMRYNRGPTTTNNRWDSRDNVIYTIEAEFYR